MIPNIAMLQWIAYIKSLNPDIQHISGQQNNVADMFSRARCEGNYEEGSDDEEVLDDFFSFDYECKTNAIQ
jgi:hypothetical protein